MHKSRDELIREINLYKQNQHLYVKLSEILRIILRKISKDVSSEGIVQIRAKPVQSFAEKIQRTLSYHLLYHTFTCFIILLTADIAPDKV